MIDKLKKLYSSETTRNFLIYSFGALFLKGISFVLMPLYTRILIPSVYGNLDLLNTYSGILDVFFSMGLAQVVFIEFLHHDVENKLKMLNRVMSLYSTVSLALYAVMFVITAGNFLNVLNGVSSMMIAMSFATTYLLFFQSLLLTILRLTGKAVRATVFQVVLGCITIAMNLLLVYYLRLGISGILITGLSIALLSAIYAYLLFRKYSFKFTFSFETDVIKQYLKLGIPFIPGALSIWMMYSANRWILLNYTNVDEVGIFSVANRFGSVFDQLMIQPFLSAYVPMAMARLKNQDKRSDVFRVSGGALLIFSVTGFAMAFIGKWIIGPAYHSALPVIPVLAIASAFSLIAQAIAIPLVYLKKSMYLLYAVTIGSLGSIAGNFLFVKHLGSMGAALGNLCGNLVWAAMIGLFIFILKKDETPEPVNPMKP